MPGLTLWVTSQIDLPQAVEKVRAAQARMIHAPDYKAAIHLAKGNCVLGSVGHSAYPVRAFPAGGAILLEGRTFDKDPKAVEAELAEIYHRVFDCGQDPQPILERWIRQVEGDYVVVMADPGGHDVLVFCDVWGRLPLYYYQDGNSVILARECKFVQHLKPDPGFDRVAWAQTLWFSYAMGDRTLYKDVRLAPHAAMFRIRSGQDGIRTDLRSLFTFDFDAVDESEKTPGQHAAALVDLFVDACRTIVPRESNSQVVLSLSGGQDSRVLAAGLRRAGVPFVATTFLDAGGVAGRDAAVAEKTSQSMGFPWRLYRLSPPGLGEMRRLVAMLEGHNYTAMAFILSYLEQVQQEWGRTATMIMGDGGNRGIPIAAFQTRMESFDDFVVSIIRRDQRMPALLASRITGVPEDALMEELRQEVGAYPEKDLHRRSLHYLLCHRDRKWLYQGEERNRFFFWHGAPFYTFRFCQYALRLPDRLKRGGRLYVRFQKLLDPVMAAMPDANSGLTPGTLSHGLMMRVVEWRRTAPDWVRNLVQTVARRKPGVYKPPPEVLHYLRERLESSHALQQLICAEEARKLLSGSSEATFAYLCTLAMVQHAAEEGILGPAGEATVSLPAST